MYGSYLKISFSFIVANPTILHRYKCLCSVSGVCKCAGARLCVLFTRSNHLSFFFYSPFKPLTPTFFSESKKNVIHHSMMEYICLRMKKSRFVLFILLFAVLAVLSSSLSLPTHQNPMNVWICKRSLPILQGSLISILPPHFCHLNCDDGKKEW